MQERVRASSRRRDRLREEGIPVYGALVGLGCDRNREGSGIYRDLRATGAILPHIRL